MFSHPLEKELFLWLSEEHKAPDDSFAKLFHLRLDVDSAVLAQRRAIINMIAVLLGSAPQSSHLYAHLFTPDAIKDTFGVGVQVLFIRILLAFNMLTVSYRELGNISHWS